MTKKTVLLFATAALALALPAFASGAVDETGLTQTAGTLVPAGKIITATNVGQLKVTSTKTGNITCAEGKVMAEGKLTENTNSTVLLGSGGNFYKNSCLNASGGAARFNNPEISKLDAAGETVTAGGLKKGIISLTFEIELSVGGVACTYIGTNQEFTYSGAEKAGLGGSQITITEQPLAVFPAACGTTAKLDGTFKLATGETATAVYIM